MFVWASAVVNFSSVHDRRWQIGTSGRSGSALVHLALAIAGRVRPLQLGGRRLNGSAIVGVQCGSGFVRVGSAFTDVCKGQMLCLLSDGGHRLFNDHQFEDPAVSVDRGLSLWASAGTSGSARASGLAFGPQQAPRRLSLGGHLESAFEPRRSYRLEASRLRRLLDQSQVFTSPSATYVGVYDGHGGPEASRFVNKNLFRFLHEFETKQKGLSADVLKKAFNATEEEFFHLVKRELPVRPQIASAGSCCLVGAISNAELYVANLGDSRVVLGRKVSRGDKDYVVAERLSNDHNVAYEEVRKEVEALHPDDSPIVFYCDGVWRIKGIIQVSRSIGDVYLKKPEFNRDPIFQQFGNPVPLKRAVLSAEPSIISRKLKPQDLFLIFASDGLWEHLSDEEAVEIVFKNPRAGIAKRLVATAIQEAAKKREMRYKDIKKIEKGNRRRFHDDITVIVIYLDQQIGSVNRKHKRGTVGSVTAPIDIFSRRTDEVVDDLIF